MRQRLQKLLSGAGLCSRRTAETWIEAGRVTVNGVRARLGDQADPETDEVQVDGIERVALPSHDLEGAGGYGKHERVGRVLEGAGLGDLDDGARGAEELEPRAAAMRGEEALRNRRRMLMVYDMYLECRATGQYLQKCLRTARVGKSREYLHDERRGRNIFCPAELQRTDAQRH